MDQDQRRPLPFVAVVHIDVIDLREARRAVGILGFQLRKWDIAPNVDEQDHDEHGKKSEDPTQDAAQKRAPRR